MASHFFVELDTTSPVIMLTVPESTQIGDNLLISIESSEILSQIILTITDSKNNMFNVPVPFGVSSWSEVYDTSQLSSGVAVIRCEGFDEVRNSTIVTRSFQAVAGQRILWVETELIFRNITREVVTRGIVVALLRNISMEVENV
jgi:hypothetical protein